MGTLYISGIVDWTERNVRAWVNKVGRPNHVVPTIFEREIHPEPWPVVWLGKELGTLFIERMRKWYADSSDPKERAAIGGLVPPEGRVQSIVEMTSKTIYGDPLPPLTNAELRTMDDLDKSLLQRAKAGIIRVIEADDADEAEEPER